MGFNPVSSFAPPYGNVNSLVTRIIQESGFTTSRTANPEDAGYNYKSTSPFFLKNQSMEVNTSLSQVQTLIDTAKANKTWVILVFHQIDNNGGQYSMSPATLQSIVDYINTSGIQTVTVSQGLNQMLN
jgi:ABC-type Zn uptake system ZnuABC Zn-binding protein ZnuA